MLGVIFIWQNELPVMMITCKAAKTFYRIRSDNVTVYTLSSLCRWSLGEDCLLLGCDIVYSAQTFRKNLQTAQRHIPEYSTFNCLSYLRRLCSSRIDYSRFFKEYDVCSNKISVKTVWKWKLQVPIKYWTESERVDLCCYPLLDNVCNANTRCFV
jgi:hypothetical protein